ncbi:hypothetical protein [Saccharibacillus sp. JS10]|uniref:hypothetical protein n=1 Tax=Saccharibacillus sp. JS10 TaxID=2950552 RepID=UPI002108E1AC|nr:hypothetical protein [Saccharibacillus sp. JS10]MCQ4088221.1 hypothetical protein [Saccharibacillus sp. JS10]
MEHNDMDFEQLMDESYFLPNGAAKVALLEKAAELADLEGDVEAGYEAREALVEAASFGGFPLKAIVAYSWQLGQYDRNPEAFDSQTLMWNYKWIIDDVPSFAEVPTEQIFSLLEDLRRRYLEYGVSDRTYWYYYFRLAMGMGDMEKAGECLKQFRTLKRDSMSDCTACELDEEVHYLNLLQEDEKALKKAKPIIEGRKACAEVPEMTLPGLLMPLHRLGRSEEAEEMQRRSYSMLGNHAKFVRQYGDHIGYLSVVDPQRALPLLERHLPQAESAEDPVARMLFFWNAAALLSKLQKTDESVALSLPPSSSFYPLIDRVADLQGQLEEQAFAIASALDKRNGNDFHTQHGQRILAERG